MKIFAPQQSLKNFKDLNISDWFSVDNQVLLKISESSYFDTFHDKAYPVTDLPKVKLLSATLPKSVPFGSLAVGSWFNDGCTYMLKISPTEAFYSKTLIKVFSDHLVIPIEHIVEVK